MNTILRTLETEHKNWVIEHSGYDQLYRVKNSKTGVSITGAYTTELIAHEALNAYAAQPRRNMPGPGAGHKGPRSKPKKEKSVAETFTGDPEALPGGEFGVEQPPENAVDLTAEFEKLEQESKDMRVM